MGGTLNEPFKPARLTYTADVGPGGAQIEIIPTATSRRYAALRIDGAEVKSGQPFAFLLGHRMPVTCTIEVVAPDRSTSRTYTLTVRVKA